MPKLKNRVPAYHHDRASGQAIVTLAGQDFYLGPWKSSVSRAEYDRVTGEWFAAGRQLQRNGAGAPGVTVAEIVNGYRKFAATYYRKADDTPTNEFARIVRELSLLTKLYVRLPVEQFSPLNRDYVKENRPIVEQEIEKAGSRLAMILNRAFAPPRGTSPIPMPAVAIPPVAPHAPTARPKLNTIASLSDTPPSHSFSQQRYRCPIFIAYPTTLQSRNRRLCLSSFPDVGCDLVLDNLYYVRILIRNILDRLGKTPDRFPDGLEQSGLNCRCGSSTRPWALCASHSLQGGLPSKGVSHGCAKTPSDGCRRRPTIGCRFRLTANEDARSDR